MKAVIFAAGLGTRLRPLTDTTPKPLIPVAGRPILLRTLEALPEAVDQVIIVVGYKGGMIRQSVSDDSRRITFVEQPELKGTYHSLLCARAFLDEGPYLVLNGDDLYSKEDLERLVAAGPTSMLAHAVPRPNPYSHLESENGFLKRIVRNSDVPSDLAVSRTYVGAAVLDAGFCDLAPAELPGGEFGLPQTLEKHLATNPVRLIESTFWMPVGTPEELAAAERALTIDKTA